MTDKTHLEEALEFLINEEEEKAVSSFHKFIVDRARAIHESLLEDDDLDEDIDSEEVDESKDEEVDESKDESKEEVEESKDEEVDESNDESKEEVEESMNEFFGKEDLGVSEMEMDGEEYGDDMEMGDEMEMNGEEVVISKDEAIEAIGKLEELEAKFREITGIPEEGYDDEMEMGDEMGDEYADDMGMGDEEVDERRFNTNTNPFAESKESDEEAVEEAVSHGDGVQSTAGTDAKGEGKHGSNSKIAHNSDTGKGEGKISEGEFDYDLTEEDFTDLEEGLKSVDVKMGGEQGHGKFAGEETNTKSPVADKDKSDIAVDPKTGVSKQDEHGTYKLENAPSNDSLPHSNENNHDKAEGTPGRSTVAGHGGPESNSKQGGEQGGKKFAGTETNVKSPIGSAGTRNEK